MRMWGGGGRFYWGTSEEERRKRAAADGIVVIFAWMSSQERSLKPFVDLYSSLGWISLVCHSDFLTLFFPDKATSLARGVLKELVKEVRIRPLPIVFAAFSGGSKGCLYKVLQLMDGKCEGQLSLVERQLVRDCVCGQVFDSSPVDFTSDLGTRFVLHPSVLKMSQPPRVVAWMTKAFASGLNVLFLNRFEAQRADYWQTLYSSVNVSPVLIFCSEDDELAPYHVVSNFAQCLQELSGDVRLVKWHSSPHVGHYKHHPVEYKAAVSEFLAKTIFFHTQRRRSLGEKTTGMAGSSHRICEAVCCLHKAAICSNESLRRVAIDPSDHFFLPSSTEYHETKEGGSLVNEQKGGSFQMRSPPTINANGVLGQIPFDVCVPKNIEGWDIKPTASSGRHGHFNPIKCLRRSRL